MSNKISEFESESESIMISLRETVKFMCEMKIKVNTQRIHTVKQIQSNNREIECESKI